MDGEGVDINFCGCASRLRGEAQLALQTRHVLGIHVFPSGGSEQVDGRMPSPAMTMEDCIDCSVHGTCVVRATASLNQPRDDETFFVYPPVAPNQR
jgi:hypothetical protein